MGIITVKDSYSVNIDLEENYDAIIETIEEVEQKKDSPFYKPDVKRLRITYKLLTEKDEDGKPVRVPQYVNASPDMGKGAVLYQIFSQLMYGGKPMPSGTQLDWDDLVGIKCRIYYGEKANRDGTTKIDVCKVTPSKKAEASKRKALEDELNDL